MLKIILVDDHKIVRTSLKCLLEIGAGNLQVTAEAASAEELFFKLQDTAADVVLMDINLPEIDGLAATSYLKEHYPETKVIILSMLDNEQYVAKALAAGALGYLTKTATRVELVQAILIVAGGNRYISPEINFLSLGKAQRALALAVTPEKLSQRESLVLNLIAEGYSTVDIADKLFISKRTVETHRRNILNKTNSKNTAKLVVYASRNHLLD